MPLIKSGSKKAKSVNISRLSHEGKPHNQSIAIAMNIARRYRKQEGGDVEESRVPYQVAGLKNPLDWAKYGKQLATEAEALQKSMPKAATPATSTAKPLPENWSSEWDPKFNTPVPAAPKPTYTDQGLSDVGDYLKKKHAPQTIEHEPLVDTWSMENAKNQAVSGWKNLTENAHKRMDEIQDKFVYPEFLREFWRKKGGYETPSYRGSRNDASYDSRRSPYPEEEYFSAHNPKLANMYANTLGNINDPKILEGARIQPLWLNTKNYLEWDAKGTSYNINNTPAIKKAREDGKSGVIMRNIWDEPGNTKTGAPETVYISLDKTTVKSRHAKRFDPSRNDLLRSGVGIAGPSMAIMSAPSDEEGVVRKKSGGAVHRMARKYASGGDVDPWESYYDIKDPSAQGAREQAATRIRQSTQPEGGKLGDPDMASRMALSAADPFGVPSWAVGQVSPETRDAWRGAYEGTTGGTIGSMMAPVPGKAFSMPAQALAAGIKAAPKTAAGIGAAGLSLMPSDAQAEISTKPTEDEAADLVRLNNAIKEKELTLEQIGKRYRNNPTVGANVAKPHQEALTRLGAEADKIKASIQKRMDAQTAEQEAAARQQREAQFNRTERQRESEAPFRETKPDLYRNLPIYSSAGALGVGALTGMLGKGKKLLPVATGTLAGGMEGALTAAAPTAIDASTLPYGSPFQKEASGWLGSPDYWKDRVAPEVGLSAGLGGLGAYGGTFGPQVMQRLGHALRAFKGSAAPVATTDVTSTVARTKPSDSGVAVRQNAAGKWVDKYGRFAAAPAAHADGGPVQPTFDQRFSGEPQQAPQEPPDWLSPRPPFQQPDSGGGGPAAPQGMITDHMPMSTNIEDRREDPVDDTTRMRIEIDGLHNAVEREIDAFHRKRQQFPGSEQAVWPHRANLEKYQERIGHLEEKIEEAERNAEYKRRAQLEPDRPPEPPPTWEGPPSAPSSSGGMDMRDIIGGVGGVGGLLWLLNRGRGRPPVTVAPRGPGGRFQSPTGRAPPEPTATRTPWDEYRPTLRKLRKEPEFARGGDVPWYTYQQSRSLMREGMMGGNTPGRSDKLPLNVPAGSYIVPADIVSGMGQGNSQAGASILGRMFKAGPLGMRPQRKRFAEGGEVPIAISDGEYVISPEMVSQIGGGDLDRGHNTLDKFVKSVRQHTIKTLKTLKDPKKN